MLGWPALVADQRFPVSAQGVSGSVATDLCLVHVVFQLLKLEIRERFGNVGHLEHPGQDCISFCGQPILGTQGVAFYAVQTQPSLCTDPIREATARFIFCTARPTHECFLPGTSANE